MRWLRILPALLLCGCLNLDALRVGPAEGGTPPDGASSPDGPAVGLRFASVGTPALQDNDSIVNLVVPMPPEVAPGDVLLATLLLARSGSSPGGPSVTDSTGWNAAAPRVNSGIYMFASYYRVAGSAEPSTWTFGTDAGVKGIGVISSYRGADPDLPLDVGVSAVGVQNVTSYLAPPAISASGGALAIVTFAGSGASGSSNVWSESADDYTTRGSASSSSRSLLLADAPVVLAGPAPPASATVSTPQTNAFTQTVIFKPAR